VVDVLGLDVRVVDVLGLDVRVVDFLELDVRVVDVLGLDVRVVEIAGLNVRAYGSILETYSFEFHSICFELSMNLIFDIASLIFDIAFFESSSVA